MIPIVEMSDYFRWLSYSDYLRFSFGSSIATVYGFDRCDQTKVLNHTKADWNEIIPESAMAQISNSNVINANALFSTLNILSGEVSNDTQSVALTNFDLNNDTLYEGLVLLIIILFVNRLFTYLLLFRKVKALK
jgi:hypothetical protein